MSRRSADGPEPGRGRGLGAPWTPPPTRCERPGREYRVSAAPSSRHHEPVPWIISVPASSSDVAKPCAIVSRFNAESTFSRCCSVTASATLRHCERSGRRAAAGRQGAAVDSDLVARRPSVTAPPPRRGPQCSCRPHVAYGQPPRKSRSCLQFRGLHYCTRVALCARAAREGSLARCMYAVLYT